MKNYLFEVTFLPSDVHENCCPTLMTIINMYADCWDCESELF